MRVYGSPSGLIGATLKQRKKDIIRTVVERARTIPRWKLDTYTGSTVMHVADDGEYVKWSEVERAISELLPLVEGRDMSEPEHTAGPLPICIPLRGDAHYICDAEGGAVADAESPEWAAHIVRCVNAMPAMVKLLDEWDAAAHFGRWMTNDEHAIQKLRENTRAALKAYEES